jgi:uncharacterized protein
MLKNTENQGTPVKSPCRNVCTLDDKGKCVGCFRKLDEIANWSANDEKRKVMTMLELRMQLPEYFD